MVAAPTGEPGKAPASPAPKAARPSVIVMNPPFSISQSRGEDPNTAARHLRSALDHLLPGGRVVAIMPDWFGPNARMRDLFETTLEFADATANAAH